MSSDDRIDIAEPLREICDRLGLKYENVATLTFMPSHVVAAVYREDENGSKFIEEETNEAAMDTQTFEVTT